MIDWPNLVAGFVLGVLTTLAFWLIDRAQASRERKADALKDWAIAAKQIELALWQPTTTAADLYRLRVQYPVDRWRAMLGAGDFKKLERLESAYNSHQIRPSQASLNELNEARIAFASLSRGMQSGGYSEVMDAEHRQKVRREFWRHPIKVTKRERRNKKMHAAMLQQWREEQAAKER